MMLSGDREIWGWGCSECRGPDFADGDSKRKARNCDDEKQPLFRVYRAWAPGLRSCPWAQLSDDRIWSAIEVWKDWRDYQVLPDTGDLLDQEAWVYEVIATCENITRTIQNENENSGRKGQDNNMTNLDRKLAAKKGSL